MFRSCYSYRVRQKRILTFMKFFLKFSFTTFVSSKFKSESHLKLNRDINKLLETCRISSSHLIHSLHIKFSKEKEEDRRDEKCSSTYRLDNSRCFVWDL